MYSKENQSSCNSQFASYDFLTLVLESYNSENVLTQNTYMKCNRQFHLVFVIYKKEYKFSNAAKTTKQQQANITL